MLDKECNSVGDKAVFIDRDGVLVDNVTRRDGTTGSPRYIGEFRISDGAAEFIQRCVKASYVAIVVTNQPDIARKMLSIAELDAMHQLLVTSIPDISRILVCPHDNSDNCSCRKPRPGLLIQAEQELGIGLKNSWMIGDRSSDIEAAHSIGIRSVCVPSRAYLQPSIRLCNSEIPHFIAADLTDAWAHINDPSESIVNDDR